MAYFQNGQYYNSNGQPAAQPPPVPPRPHGYNPINYYITEDKTSAANESGSLYSGPQYGDAGLRAPNQQRGGAGAQQYASASRPSVLPYPLDPEDSVSTGQSPQNYTYQSAAQASTYNPQEYAQVSHAASYSTHPPTGSYPHQSLGIQMNAPTQNPGVQHYNPALYRDNNMAHTMNRMAGQLPGSSTSPSRYPQASAAATSPSSYHPSYMPSPSQTTNQRRSFESPSYQTHEYSQAVHPPTTAPGMPTSSPQQPEYQSPSMSEAHSGDFLSVSTSNQSFFNSPSPEIRETPSPAMSPAFIPPPRHPVLGGYEPEPGYFQNTGLPPSPRAPEPPRHSSQRLDNQRRHPQSRALPVLPPDVSPDNVDDRTLDELAQDDLFNEIANAISAGEGTSPGARHNSRGMPMSRYSSSAQQQYPRPANLDATTPDSINGPRTNGYRLSAQSVLSAHEDDFGYDSDAEAAAGLEAMRMAEAQEAADRTRQESISQPPPVYSSSQEGESSGEHSLDDYGETGVDVSSFGGAYFAPASYGVTQNQLVANHNNGFEESSQHYAGISTQPRLPGPDNGEPMRSASNTSRGYSSGRSYSGRSRGSPAARVDYGGTGGLSDPTALTRKLSFDEGDERPYIFDAVTPDDASGEIRDFEYYPPTISRPLPPPPFEEQDQFAQFGDPHYLPVGQVQYPEAPDAYTLPSQGNSNVPRSISLMSQSSTPLLLPPIRAKTDAEDRKRQSMIRGLLYGSETDYQTTPQTPAHIGLDLPTLPLGRRFQPSKFTQRDFDKCREPWALTSIISWLRVLAEGESELKENAIVDALTALFSNKVPTMSVADTETLVARVVSEMFEAGTLVQEEEWLKLGSGTTTGVLFQLTGQGCYAPKAHDYDPQGRCYAYHCQRTVKKIKLQTDGERNREGWATFYKVKKEDYENLDKKEVEKQNVLHEIVQTEDDYMDQLTVLQFLYRKNLVSASPPIIAPKKLKTFERDVFGKLDAVQKANEDYLLPQLKYRQQEQGPWITGFSDIFRDWIRKAKAAYIDYAAAYPNANFLMRQENEKNENFHFFLEGARNNQLSNRLSWETYLKAPITRLQRYGLLLSTVHKNMIQDSEEKSNLQTAIDEIKAVTLDCDNRVAETSRKVDLSDLSSRLILRQEMRGVELNLSHLGRQLIYRGDLQRIGTSRFTWLDIHAMLFDHYLVLAKTVTQVNSAGGRSEKYDVSKMPIPMDLLILESTDDAPVIKSKGIASVTSVTTKAGTPADVRANRHNSVQSAVAGSLTPVNSNVSSVSVSSASTNKTMVTTTNLESQEKILYPFRVKHLGKEVYTLYASSAGNRIDWCDKIKEAKTKHAASLFAQNAEPFRLRVLADSAFAYDNATVGQRSILIKGTPLSRAIDEVESAYQNTGRPVPICRARVNCATTFVQPNGKHMIAVGSDYGVYVSEMGNPRGWSRAITIPRVTQLAVLEDFNLCLLISDKSLIAYHLDVVCPTGGRDSLPSSSDDSNRKAPQKLSGTKDVGFFVAGRMKDRTLVFYKKREGMSSIFKILEPVLNKASTANTNTGRPTSHRFSSFTASLHRSSNTKCGTTDFFREYDEFYIPTDCTSISLFNSTLSVSTTKGFEVLNLDKKTPWSIPDLKPPDVAKIASRLSGCDPVAMFRLNDTGHISSAHQRNPSGSEVPLHPDAQPSPTTAANAEFLCVYSECAVYVNKHGDISRSVVMEFVGRARAAALHGPYLLLFDADFVEIRNAQNGRLKQIVQGRDVKLLDDGRGGTSSAMASGGLGAGLVDGGAVAAPRTIKIAMQHPELERIQVVVELILNDGRRD